MVNKYSKYIIKEPIVKGRFGPVLHICGEKHDDQECGGSIFPGFPSELTSMCIKEPFLMTAPIHAHDYDQLLCFIGGNPENIFDFGAEIEITLGEEGEKHIIDSTSIIYIPKGLLHCPIDFRKVEKPIIFMHICFSPAYTRSQGEMNGHPQKRERYTPQEIADLKRNATAT